MTTTMATGFIMGILLFASHSSAVLQHKYDLDYNEANSAVHQDVYTDTDDENVVQYHVVRDDAEWWIVEDFDRDIKVSKVRYDNGEYKCLVNSLDESKSTKPSEIGAPSATNRNDRGPTMISEVTTIAANPVKDSSFLGKTASTLCADTPVYWTYRIFDNVTATDLRVDKKSSRISKRSIRCAGCCNNERRCVSKGSISVRGTWDEAACTKRCEWTMTTRSYTLETGCGNRDYVPQQCGGTGRHYSG